MSIATAYAFPNIAFIKYWGNRDPQLNIPANGSISMNLDGLETRTQVLFDASLRQDEFILNGERQSGEGLQRVRAFLDHVRRMSGMELRARVQSENNYPTGVGVASSAAAFAALSLAASAAAGLDLDKAGLSRLARLGSGSACRSIPDGFVEWKAGSDHETSYAITIAPPDHWELTDCIAVVDTTPKNIGSSLGHRLAESSPLQAARLAGADQRLAACRQAILERDFEALAQVVELDSNLLHSVTMTCSPAIFYWQPATLRIIHAVLDMRARGVRACYTVDAGPNVHVICDRDAQPTVEGELSSLAQVEKIICAHPGSGARLIDR